MNKKQKINKRDSEIKRFAGISLKKIGLLLGSAFCIIVLSSMAWVRLTLLRPAVLTLPSYITSIVLIDRTLPDETAKNKLEEVLTGEMFKQDEQAVRRVIEGITDVCAEYNLFRLERITERQKGGGTKTSFPAPMKWDQVTQLCDKYNANAILSIEIFDSDFIVTNPVNVVKQVTEGQTAGFNVNGVAVINFGVRLYDGINKQILDEYQVSQRINFNAGGYTVQDAVNHVLNKVEAINQTSYYAGRAYGERISPTYYTVVREFYSRPKKNTDLRTGVRKSEVADWKGAIESWTHALNAKRKVARRAAFNIAVAYEVLGDLEKAKEWASKSYTEYGEKRGKPYYDALVYRQREEAVIKRQTAQ